MSHFDGGYIVVHLLPWHFFSFTKNEKNKTDVQSKVSNSFFRKSLKGTIKDKNNATNGDNSNII